MARGARRFGLPLVLGLILLGGASRGGVAAEPRVSSEYDLKAAFLFNFTRFVDWPDDAFAGPTAPFTIGILGDDPFGRSLDDVVANETARDRRIVVRRFQTVEQAESCQILFIGSHDAGEVDHAFTALAHRSVLTVGETPPFSAGPGMIAFAMSQQRLRLRINVGAARAARLTISSQLLRQAQVVGSGRRGE